MTLINVAGSTWVNPEHVVFVLVHKGETEVRLVTVKETVTWSKNTTDEAMELADKIAKKFLDAENDVLL